MATYSKYPIIKKGTVSISGENINNVCIFSDIVILEDTVRVYNIHLASNTFDNKDYQFIEKPTVGKFPALRIDYILMSPNFKINNFETTKVELSDHYPITVYFD